MRRTRKITFGGRMTRRAFTLVELLVVIAIVGLLSGVAVVATNNARDKAKIAKATADLKQITKQIDVARTNNNSALIGVTVNGCSDCNCRAGVHLPSLPSSDACITAMALTMSRIGMGGLPRDPWGSPYLIDENEMEAGGCARDVLFSAGPDGIDALGAGDDISVEVPYFQCL